MARRLVVVVTVLLTLLIPVPPAPARSAPGEATPTGPGRPVAPPESASLPALFPLTDSSPGTCR